MNAKKMGELTVNDGKGLLDSEGVLDTLLESLNILPKLLIDNQFIAFCNQIAQMGQKIQLLKNGIKADLESKDKNIESLKQQLRYAEMNPQEFIKEIKGEQTDGE